MNILYITDYNFTSDRLQISSFDMVYKGEAAVYNIYKKKLSDDPDIIKMNRITDH